MTNHPPELDALVAALAAVARGDDPEVDPDEAYEAALAAARAAAPVDLWAGADPESPVVIIAGNLKQLRNEAGWSQPAVADLMVEVGFDKWTRQTVAEIERTARRVSWEEAWALAILFGVPIVEILDPAGYAVAVSEAIVVPDEHATELLVGRGGRVGQGGPNWASGCVRGDVERPARDLWANRRAMGER
jgi:transcriptional regulator with XRE-family HTH domain